MKKILILFFLTFQLIEAKADEQFNVKIEDLMQELSDKDKEVRYLRRKMDYVFKETLEDSGRDELSFYLDKLKDSEFTNTYGDGYIWRIAAEELGAMGKSAVPHLIKKLDTEDDYERTQTLYALRLAAQCGNVKVFTYGEYVKASEAFPDVKEHAELIREWKLWYDKYRDYFE
jgi:hypothetical protein